MPSCSILRCKARKSDGFPLTLHRLPKKEVLRKKWVEIIGSNNIRMSPKAVYICSQHFEDTSFNRTLNVIRLRDDAVPSAALLPFQNDDNQPQTKSNLMIFASPSDRLSSDAQNQQGVGCLERKNQKPKIFESVKVFASSRNPLSIEIQEQQNLDCLERNEQKPDISETIKAFDTPRDPLSNEIENQQDLVILERKKKDQLENIRIGRQAEKLEKLKKRSQILSTRLKNVKKTLRRRDQRIAYFSNLIKIAKQNGFLNTKKRLNILKCANQTPNSARFPVSKLQFKPFIQTHQKITSKSAQPFRRSSVTCTASTGDFSVSCENRHIFKISSSL